MAVPVPLRGCSLRLPHCCQIAVHLLTASSIFTDDKSLLDVDLEVAIMSPLMTLCLDFILCQEDICIQTPVLMLLCEDYVTVVVMP